MSLEEWETERLRDPEFVIALAAREPAYQVARLRILRGLTQKQLAELVGTNQSLPGESGKRRTSGSCTCPSPATISPAAVTGRRTLPPLPDS